MKRHLRDFLSWEILLVVFLSILPLFSIFATSKLFHTHDGLVHLPRIAAFYKALYDGQFPVRWAGDLNYGYGMPLFNFIYQFPYFISSLLLFLGLSLVNSFKIALALSYLLSGAFMYLFSKEFFQDGKKAMLVAVFYQFAPFRLIELLVRGSFGEVYTYAFLPLVLYGLTRLFKKITYRHFFLTSIATALLILSHNSVSLMFVIVCVLFVIIFSPNKKTLSLGFLALGAGIALSAFYFLPAIFEHKYTYGDLFMKKLYLSHFTPLQNFFIPNFTNSKALQTEGISVQLGILHVVATILASLTLLKKTRKGSDPLLRRVFIFSFLLLIGSFFFMLPISKSVWANVSFLRQFQFPWRFLSIVIFATSILSVSFLSFPVFKKKWAFFLLLSLTIVSTIYYWRPPLGYDTIDEAYYWNFSLNTTYFGETDLVWSAGPAHSYPKKRIEVVSGEATLSNVKKKSNLHTFTVEAKTKAEIVDKTQYFPGWRVYIDGKSVPIQFQNPSWRGLMMFSIPQGTHSVRVAFGESKIRLFADIVSLTTLIILILGLLVAWGQKYRLI